jgi:hypothetical protein
MKKIILLSLIAGILSACSSKVNKTTSEHRGNPARGIAYGGFVQQRAEQLQQMGGPFKDRAVAEQKATEEANTRFGADANDLVTTTWSTDPLADKARAQDEFNDKLHDMEKQKRVDQ